MDLFTNIARSAERNLDKVAVYWGPDEVSYRTIMENSVHVADRLRRQARVQPGDRVGIWLKNRPEFIGALLGILRVGAVAVPINNFLKAGEVGYIVSDAGIDVMITDEQLAPATAQIGAQRAGLEWFTVESFHAADPDAGSASQSEPPVQRDPADLAVIIYTSGTTGHPKGAMLSHHNLISNVESCRQMLCADEHDRIAVLLPMFHSFMMTVGILLPLTLGCPVVLVRSLHPPKNIFQELIQRQATILPAIPQLFRTMAHATLPAKLPLRLCISGAAPLPGEILKEFTEKLSLPLIEGYGLSEASPVVSLNPIAGPWKAGSIGVPVHGVEVTIRDENGAELPAGKTGELCVRGANVMQGYWNKPEETAQTIREGWLLTGDIGFRDEDGYFYITDRKKDMLLVNGINVYPREIEEVLYQFPGVREAAVVGRKDSRKGEQPVAFLSANEGAEINVADVVRFVKERMADYKVPKQITILDALPRTATGKILKTKLRDLLN